jgi:sugar phosphate isomerase/epimerase
VRICQADWNHWPEAPSPAEADPGCWAACAALGVGGVEVGVYDAAVELSAEREATRDTLAAAHGVPVAALLLSLPAEHWRSGALSGSDVDRLVLQVTACAAVARRRHLDVLGLWPGADPPDASWSACVDTLARCRDAAAAHGVRLAVEYKPGTVVPDLTAALRLAADVPGTGVLLDTGHAWAAGEDPAGCVRALAAAGVLWQVHLGDAAPGGADDDLPLGALHSPAPLRAALSAVGYAGTATFDLYGAVSGPNWTGVSALRASLAALRP